MTACRRVLVVEDEMMIAMMIEDMLADLGHVIVGPAMRLETALPLARDAEFDMAVLDVNLGEVKSSPIAAVLRERGIPFVFATGYGKKGIEAEYADAIVLDKPFEAHELRRAIHEASR